MRACSYFNTVVAGLGLCAVMAAGLSPNVKAAPVGFAAGGNTPAGAYPIGNDTIANPASAANGTSSLGIGIPINTGIIDNYMAAGTCPWVAPALGAEGYGNNWTINYVTLPVAAIALTVYGPWVNNIPAVTAGGQTLPGVAAQGLGGAAIGLSYAPTAAAIAAGDPNPAGGTYLNWIQVFASNTPPYGVNGVTGVNVGGGSTAYIDNAYLANQAMPNNPFYGGLNSGTGAYAGTATSFIDTPSRFLPANAGTTIDWQAQVFLASWNPNVAPVGNSNTNNTAAVIAGGGTITVYDGVWWGFQLTVPEPSTYALMISAGLCGLAVWLYQTVRQRNTACSSAAA